MIGCEWERKELLRRYERNTSYIDHNIWTYFFIFEKHNAIVLFGSKVQSLGNDLFLGIWKDEKAAIPNKELKSRVEFYKETGRGKQKGGPEL